MVVWPNHIHDHSHNNLDKKTPFDDPVITNGRDNWASKYHQNLLREYRMMSDLGAHQSSASPH